MSTVEIGTALPNSDSSNHGETQKQKLERFCFFFDTVVKKREESESRGRDNWVGGGIHG